MVHQRNTSVTYRPPMDIFVARCSCWCDCVGAKGTFELVVSGPFGGERILKPGHRIVSSQAVLPIGSRTAD
jgi:hypothetical protein